MYGFGGLGQVEVEEEEMSPQRDKRPNNKTMDGEMSKQCINLLQTVGLLNILNITIIIYHNDQRVDVDNEDELQWKTIGGRAYGSVVTVAPLPDARTAKQRP